MLESPMYVIAPFIARSSASFCESDTSAAKPINGTMHKSTVVATVLVLPALVISRPSSFDLYPRFEGNSFQIQAKTLK